MPNHVLKESRFYLLTEVTLDRILHLGVLAFNTGFDEGRVSEDEHRRCTDEPEKCHDWGCPPEKREADHKKCGVQGFLRDDVISDLHWLWSEFVNGGEATNEEGERNEEEGVGDYGVDRKGSHNEAIIAGEISSVVRYPLGSLTEIRRP